VVRSLPHGESGAGAHHQRGEWGIHAGEDQYRRQSTPGHAQFGVQGIPAVKLFRDGQIVGEFVGALPEPKVREFIKKYAPNQSDLILTAAQDLARAKKWAEAEAAYRHALAVDPNSAQIALELSKVLLHQGKGVEAATLLEVIPSDARESEAAHSCCPWHIGCASQRPTERRKSIGCMQKPGSWPAMETMARRWMV
jgi:tetratricopeptide (TPR) repeat protein